MGFVDQQGPISYNPLDARDLERERRRRAFAEYERSLNSTMLTPEVRALVQDQLASGNIKANTQAENAILNAQASSQSNPAMAHVNPQAAALRNLQEMWAKGQQGVSPQALIPVEHAKVPVMANDAGQLYPTAGNYTNGAFDNFLMSNGIKTPTLQGIQDAQQRAFLQSKPYLDSQAEIKRAQIQSEAKVKAEQEKAKALKDKTDRDNEASKERLILRNGSREDIANLRAGIKNSKDTYKFLDQYSKDAYKEYLRNFKTITMEKNPVTDRRSSYQDQIAHLAENGIDTHMFHTGWTDGPPIPLKPSEFVKTQRHQEDLQRFIMDLTPEQMKGAEQYYKVAGMSKFPTPEEIVDYRIALQNFTPESAKKYVEYIKPAADAGNPQAVFLLKSFLKHHGDKLKAQPYTPQGPMQPIPQPAPQASMGVDPGQVHVQPQLVPGDPMRWNNVYHNLPPGTPR